MHESAIRGARVLTGSGLEELEIGIDGGRITEVSTEVAPAYQEIEAHGLLLLPGLLDDHVHFREPGKEEKEDFASGTLASAHGGVTTAFEIQNNAPLMITRAALEAKLALVRPKSRINVGLYANANRASVDHLPDMADLAVGFKLFLAPSHGDTGVDSDTTLRVVFQHAARLDKVVAIHAEDRSLIDQGIRRHAAAGATGWSKARPPAAEVRACERAIRLAELTGARIHLFHLSTAGAVDLVEDAKQRGVRVTAATCPHYLIFSDEDVKERGGLLKVNPSIKGAVDRNRLREGIRNGVLDVIETDHAPHLPDEKRGPFQDNPSGISSADVFLPALFHLLKEGVLPSLQDLMERGSRAPARIFGLEGKGRIATGVDADLVLVDDRQTWTPTEEEFCSRAKVSPYVGFGFPARVVRTFVHGKEVWPGK